MENHTHPSFREDPAFWDDCLLNYIRFLAETDQLELMSTKKPSLSDYDGTPED